MAGVTPRLQAAYCQQVAGFRAHYHGKSDAEAAGSILPAGGRLSRVGACEAARCQQVVGENMMTGVSSRGRKAEKVKQAWNTLAWQEHVVGNSGSWTVGREQSAGSGKEHSSMEQGGGAQREELGMGASASSQSPVEATAVLGRESK